MEDKEISKDEELSKDHAVYSMGFSKEELELLDDALRDALRTSMESLSKRVYNNSAEYILDDIKDELLGPAQLLMRVACVLEMAYAAEEKD